MRTASAMLVLAAGVWPLASPAQQIDGTPGSPAATTSIDRPQLSPADIQKLQAAQRNNKTSE